MAFAGWDPEEEEFAYYRSRVDGSDLQRILDLDDWFGAAGIISGNGEHFLFISFETGIHGGPGSPGFQNHVWIRTSSRVRACN